MRFTRNSNANVVTRLHTDLGNPKRVSTMADMYKHLGWHTTLEQLYTGLGEETDTYATVRQQPQADGSTKRVLLGTKLSKQYEILQNADSLNHMQKLVDAGLKPSACGVIDNGKRVWGLLEFDEDMTIGSPAKGDILHRYALYSNDHTGRQRARVSLVCVRLICTNGMTATEDLGVLHLRHKGGINESMGLAVDAIDTANHQFIAYGERLEKLMESSISAKDIDRYVKQVFFPSLKSEKEIAEKQASITAVRDTVIRNFISGPGADTVEAKGTVYGLYQAANHYLNHDAGGRNRQVSLFFGTGAQTDARALRAAEQLVASR